MSRRKLLITSSLLACLAPTTSCRYQGELGFFDCYIIPLAKKLKDCGVFGVASDEYLNYAIQNRREWEVRGKEVVDEMVDKVNGVWAGIPDISKVSDEVASGVDQL